MKDFTKSNKWINLKRKMTLGATPYEVFCTSQGIINKELFNYIELLERQIIALEHMISNLSKSEDDGK